MKARFLIDENLSVRLRDALQRRYPAIDAVRVGDPGAPAFGTLDPDILPYLQQAQRILITDNRVSMPTHLEQFAASGGQHWGIFVVHKEAPLGSIIDLLYLYWEASEAEEWVNRTEWLVLEIKPP
jgi:hypothetical protein